MRALHKPKSAQFLAALFAGVELIGRVIHTNKNKEFGAKAMRMLLSTVWNKLIMISLVCLVAGCNVENTYVAGIYNAENIHFSADDRLFVTGGLGLFEVTAQA